MIRKIMLSGVIAPLLVAVAMPVAVAQEQQPSRKANDPKANEFKPVGARVGSFILYPDLNVKQIFDDNYYKKKTNGDEQHYTSIKPSVSLRSDWNNHTLRFDGNYEHGQFYGSTADNYDNADARVRSQIDASKATKIRLEARYRQSSEARGGDDVGSDAAEPVEFSRQNGSISVNHKPNRLSLDGGLEFDRYNYKDNPTLSGGETNNDDRDRNSYKFKGRVGYEIQKGYEGFVRGEYGAVNYSDALDDNGFNRDSNGYLVEGGLAVKLSNLVRGDFGVGWLTRNFDDAQFEDFSDYSANGLITWSVTSLTDVRVSVSRSLSETTTTGTSSNLVTSYGVGVDHEFLRNFKAKGDLKFSTTDYEDDTTNYRSDDKIVASLALEYDLNRNLYGGLKYQFEDRDSNVDTNDYDRNIYTLSVGLRF